MASHRNHVFAKTQPELSFPKMLALSSSLLASCILVLAFYLTRQRTGELRSLLNLLVILGTLALTQYYTFDALSPWNNLRDNDWNSPWNRIDGSWLWKVPLLFSTQFSAVLATSIFIGDVSIDYGVFLAFVVRMPWYLQIMSHCLGENQPNPRPDHRNLVYDITTDPQPAGSIFGMIQDFMRSLHWLIFVEDLLIHASATSFILMGGNSLMKAMKIGSSGYRQIDRGKSILQGHWEYMDYLSCHNGGPVSLSFMEGSVWG
jgi:hypothetical protein